MDEHRLTGQRAATFQQRNVRGRIGDAESRGRREAYAWRQMQHLARLAFHFFGVTARQVDAERGADEDRIADLKFANARTNRGNHSTRIAARDVGKFRNNRISSASHISVRWIYPCGTHIDNDFGWTGNWIVYFVQRQNFWPTKRM